MQFFLFAFLVYGQTELQSALLLCRQGRFAEARKAMSAVPPPSDISQQIAYYRLKAAIASGLGEHSKAAQEMRAALALAPGDVSLLLGSAVAEQQAGQLDAAANLLEGAGDNAEAKLILGEIRAKQGRFPESIEAYRKAVALNPAREATHLALVRELIGLGAFDQAQEQLQQSLPAFPKSAALLTLMGILKYAGGQPDHAAEILTQAIAVDSTYEPAYRSLARIVLESSGTPEQAQIDALCKWNEIACSAVQLRVARDSGDQRLWDKSMAVLRRAPSDSAFAVCALGQGYAWSGRPLEARPSLEACVRLDPSPQNHYRLAQVYQRLGRGELAEQQLQARTRLLKSLSEQTAKAADSLKALEERTR